MITGIIPYSCMERSVIAVYLNKEKAERRYDKERQIKDYLDVEMNIYELDD